MFKGYVEDIKPFFEGNDIGYKIICGQANDKWYKTIVNVKYAEGIHYSEVIKNIANLIGLGIGKIELTVDLPYPRGYSEQGNLKKLLEDIAKNSQSIFYIEEDLLYFTPALSSLNDLIDIDFSEIIDKIEETDLGYKFKTFMNGNIKPNVKINIQNLGEMIVDKVTYIGEFETGEFHIEVEVVDVTLLSRKIGEELTEVRNDAQEQLK